MGRGVREESGRARYFRVSAMKDAPFDPLEKSEAAAAIVQKLLGHDGGVCSQVHPRDEMFLYNLMGGRNSQDCATVLYFLQGHQIFLTMRELAAWRFGSLSNVDGFLDFASGFGRGTRFLLNELPPSSIWVSDIQPDAVAFQMSTFGINGRVSGGSSEELRFDREFDVVAAVSFFSHLPHERFAGWIERLLQHVSPGGLFAFSTHGDHLLPAQPDRAPQTDGVYLAESESSRLDPMEYGTSYVREAFVRAAIRAAAGPSAAVYAFRRGICAHQDLYVIVKEPGERSPPKLTLFPRGELTRVSLTGDFLQAEGWVRDDNTGERVDAVRLMVKDSCWDEHKFLDQLPTSRNSEGQAVFHWTLEAETCSIAADDVLMVTAINPQGRSNILAISTMGVVRRDFGDSVR